MTSDNNIHKLFSLHENMTTDIEPPACFNGSFSGARVAHFLKTSNFFMQFSSSNCITLLNFCYFCKRILTLTIREFFQQ